mmetsp:Transcript_5323/g.10994  ORF Transcript_5323/g.10994 Transcript_5323/m.10994 type:complete len:108 (-) Transcript_5323:150-473(-)
MQSIMNGEHLLEPQGFPLYESHHVLILHGTRNGRIWGSHLFINWSPLPTNEEIIRVHDRACMKEKQKFVLEDGSFYCFGMISWSLSTEPFSSAVSSPSTTPLAIPQT